MSARASTNIPPSLRKVWQQQEQRSARMTTGSDTMSEISTTTAKAIVSRDTFADGGWKIEDVQVRRLEEGELLVEIVGSGICHTDALVGGLPGDAAPIAFYPRVLGHEGSGYVKEVGLGVTVAQVGDPVLLSFTYCASCDTCKGGYHSHCNDFTPLNFGGPYYVFSSKDGEPSKPDISGVFFGQSSFANLSVVKQTSVVNVKGLVDSKRELQLFSPLGCGIQTGAGTVVNAAQADSDDIICIMGLGGVGLSAIMGANIQGCKQIIGIDRISARLALAKELGATHTIDSSTLPEGKSLVDVVRDITNGGTTITIDTTGVPVLIKAGVEFTRNKGKYVQVGSAPMDFDLGVNLFTFMLSGKQILGAIEGQAYPPTFVPKMIQWYREGRFPIDRLMKLIPAADFEQGMKEMHDGTAIKPILCWS